MSSILYYSNYCEKCKDLLRMLGKSNTKSDIHFMCIDKRFKNPQNGAMYITLENNQNVILPPQVQKVPALLLLKEGNKVIFGNEINNKLIPREDFVQAKATGFNGEPLAHSLGKDNLGGFGVMSDNYSFWDQESDEMLAQGNGGLRQMYNYATIENSHKIETPPDTWSPDKVGEDSYKKMEDERNKDLQVQQMNKNVIN